METQQVYRELMQSTGSRAVSDIFSAQYDKVQGVTAKEFLSKPAGFTFALDTKVYDKGEQLVEISHNIATLYPYKHFPKIFFLDPVNGLDTNNGLSWATAVKTLNYALNTVTDVDILIVKAGQYGSIDHGSITRPPSRNVQIISYGGKSIWYQGFSGSNRTWTDLTGGVWRCPTTAANITDMYDTNVRDYDKNFFAKYTSVADQAACAATPGTYFFDNPNDLLYVHTLDALVPARNIMIRTSAKPINCTEAHITTDVHWLFDDFYILGGLGLASTVASKKYHFYAKNCNFINSPDSNGVTLAGNVRFIAENCYAEQNKLDGFNYHSSNNLNVEFMEIKCTGRYNGIGTGTNINNGSTSHENCTGIRLGGHYYGNEGRNVHDINSANVWMLYCHAHDSVATTPEAKEDFAAWNTAKQWYYKCYASGGTSVMNIEVQSTAKAYVRHSTFEKKSGLIEAY